MRALLFADSSSVLSVAESAASALAVSAAADPKGLQHSFSDSDTSFGASEGRLSLVANIKGRLSLVLHMEGRSSVVEDMNGSDAVVVAWEKHCPGTAQADLAQCIVCPSK
mmetsp:Transcript_22612/g.70985  ORF Transcript_22612/g.70985 Transcript_22612/m.70985 type:complete len:110 (-) Transcript_22612:132-461(-)